MVSRQLTERWKRARRLKEGVWEGQVISSGICWKEFAFFSEPLKKTPNSQKTPQNPKKTNQQTTFPSFLNFFFKKIYLLMESEINAQCKSSLAEHKASGGINCVVGAVAPSTSMSPGRLALGLCQLWQQLYEQGPGPREGCVPLALTVPRSLTLPGGVAKAPMLPVVPVTP